MGTHGRSRQDDSRSARFGHLIGAFTEAGATQDDLHAAQEAFANLPKLAHHQVLSWTLTVDEKTQTFAPGPDCLIHPLALGGLIENNRDGVEPSQVHIAVSLVAGSSVQKTTWPPEDGDMVGLLESMVRFPEPKLGLERSDVKLSMRNLGRFGKVSLMREHDRDPSRRWHLPRVRAGLRSRTGKKDLLVGWWDWAVTFTWMPAYGSQGKEHS